MTEEAVNTVAHALASDLHQRLPARAALRALGYVEPTTDVAGSTPAAVSTVAGSIPAAEMPGERGVDPAEEVQREKRPSQTSPATGLDSAELFGELCDFLNAPKLGSCTTADDVLGILNQVKFFLARKSLAVLPIAAVGNAALSAELELLLKGWKHYAEPTQPSVDAHPFDHARYAAERAGWVKLQRCIFEVEALLKNTAREHG